MQCFRIVIASGACAIVAGSAIAEHGFDKGGGAVTVGVTLALVGALAITASFMARLIASVTRPAADAYAEGYESGYSHGYTEGRRVGRPTVVPLAKRCCGDCLRREERTTAPVARDGAS